MPRCQDLLAKAYNNPRGLRFAELCSLAECFGWMLSRSRGSHRIHTKLGHRIAMSFQDARGAAKPYQVRQLLRAIESLDSEESEL